MAHTTSAAMIQTVALLAFIASASAIWPLDSTPKLWKSGLYQTFSINPLSWGSSSFVSLPRNLAQAEKDGWVEVQGPATPTGYEDLTLYMKLSEPTTGLYFDGKYVAGLLMALPATQTTPYFDVAEQGLQPWTYSIDGETKTFLVSSIFFVSEDKSTRTYDKNEVIQANTLKFVSIDGKMDSIPKNLTEIKGDSSSDWKKQSCVMLMGLHYYHSMTTSTTCDKPFVPYFGLFDEKTNQLIGVGYMSVGECEAIDTCEHPDEAAVKMIVKDGPPCLYDLVAEYGVCTRHIYFVNNPKIISC